jgi:hypothetical protein
LQSLHLARICSFSWFWNSYPEQGWDAFAYLNGLNTGAIHISVIDVDGNQQLGRQASCPSWESCVGPSMNTFTTSLSERGSHKIDGIDSRRQ